MKSRAQKLEARLPSFGFLDIAKKAGPIVIVPIRISAVFCQRSETVGHSDLINRSKGELKRKHL